MKYQPPLGGDDGDPYIDANPAAGIEGSAVPAAALEHPMREIVAAIEGAGLIPNSEDLNQLAQAMAANAGTIEKDLGWPGAHFGDLTTITVSAPSDGVLIACAYADTSAIATGAIVGELTVQGSSTTGDSVVPIWYVTSAPLAAGETGTITMQVTTGETSPDVHSTLRMVWVFVPTKG